MFAARALRRGATLLCAALLVCMATPVPAASPTPAATSSPSPQRVLGLIRARFRSHRPPPPFVVYTIERRQRTEEGYPDYLESYTEHIWCRSLDRAAMARRILRGGFRGDPMFERPAFNEPRDPGPPTADLFEPAPLHPHPIEFVPTPEAVQTQLPVIGSVTSLGEFDYKVVSLSEEGPLVHLIVTPQRDPDRNRLREIFADKQTYELRKLVATDKLFVGGDIFGVIFTITVDQLQGVPVVTFIHGKVGDNYEGDGKEIDYYFRDIAFPPTLPDWYFNAKTWKAHRDDFPV